MEKEIRIDSRYPSIDDLRKRAQKENSQILHLNI